MAIGRGLTRKHGLKSDETGNHPETEATSVDAGQIGEETLVRGAMARDQKAFAALYDRFADRLYQYAYYRVSSATDAEDLTQQIFLQAWRAIDRYQPTGAPFLAWLFRIAHNVVISHYRRRRDEVYLDTEMPVPDTRDGPGEILQMELDGEEVRRTILRLKPDHQQVIILRFVEELGYPEVAAAMEKSESTVRVLQYRALREMRRLMGAREAR
jgi:RNA polymerase sigma-70 factor, ECF subfamily